MKANGLLLFQGIYTTLTGAWPLVHMDSFLFITGPKTDIWLVKTVALLLVCMGLSFLNTVSRKGDAVPGGILLLSITSAIALSSVDIYYTLNGIISLVYLMDGFLQIVFLIVWCLIITRYLIIRRRQLVNFAP